MLVVEAMAEEFERRSVECVFGIPGKELVRLGVELQARGIRFHAVRHETQGIMMADGYWRATGKIGIAVLAQGAGFANAVGGLSCASRARSGVVAISGDLLISSAGNDPKALAIRQLKGISPPTVCEGIQLACVRPQSAQTFMAEFRNALNMAEQGQAVSLTVPSDLFSAQTEYSVPAQGSRGDRPLPAVAEDELEAIAELLMSGWAAKKPVIIAGRGAVRSGALPALRELAERIGALVATSLAARLAFGDDLYNLGVCGTFATPTATKYITQADLVLSVGASLNPFTTYGQSMFSDNAALVQVDVDPAARGKYVDPQVFLAADAKSFAEQLLNRLDGAGYRASGLRTPEIADEIAAYNPRSGFTDQSVDDLIDPRTLMISLNELLPRKRLVVIDAGMHLHYACMYLDVERPEDFVFPLDSLAVGLGMGAAIGASVGRRDHLTVLEVGDCGFMMSLGDLDTAVRLKVPLVIIVSNDQAWGAEAQHLQALELPDDYVKVPTPSLADVAVAMGAEGYTITSQDDLKPLLARDLTQLSGPVVLDCRINPSVQPESFNFDYAGVFAK